MTHSCLKNKKNMKHDLLLIGKFINPRKATTNMDLSRNFNLQYHLLVYGCVTLINKAGLYMYVWMQHASFCQVQL